MNICIAVNAKPIHNGVDGLPLSSPSVMHMNQERPMVTVDC